MVFATTTFITRSDHASIVAPLEIGVEYPVSSNNRCCGSIAVPLPLPDPEERGVEASDVVQEPTPARYRPTGHNLLGVVVLVSIPALSRDSGNQILPSSNDSNGCSGESIPREPDSDHRKGSDGCFAHSPAPLRLSRHFRRHGPFSIRVTEFPQHRCSRWFSQHRPRMPLGDQAVAALELPIRVRRSSVAASRTVLRARLITNPGTGGDCSLEGQVEAHARLSGFRHKGVLGMARM